MYCPACGQEVLDQPNFCSHCGHPLTPEVQAAPTPPAVVHYAGFWRRFVAYFLDAFIVFVTATGAGALLRLMLGVHVILYRGLHPGLKQSPGASALGFFLSALIAWLYWALLESSQRQATLGKMALGLKVTDLQGRPISFGRATGRYFGKIISGLIFCIGFMMAGWTQKKQALHDLMAGTLVIMNRTEAKPASTPEPEESLL